MKGAVIASIVLAAVTTWWTWWPSKSETAASAARTPALLTLDGRKVEPDDVVSLRVASWDADAKEPQVFEVARKGGVWVIPSKYDYPADGGSRVGATAGGVTNVPRGALVSGDAKQHAAFGVVDPLKDGAAESDGRGKRVTLKDKSGATVVDLVVGKAAEHPGLSYVREAGSDDVYTAKVDVDISTAFKDWVETDPLKILAADLRMLAIRDYSLNVEKQEIDERASTVFERKKDQTDWACAETPEGMEVDQDALGRLLGEAGAIRLVDVFPFSSPNLYEKFGFFRTEDNHVYGKEGVLTLGAKDGLVYHLYFGNVAVTDESGKEAKPKEESGANEKDGKEKTPLPKPASRYMAVFLSYDPDLDEAAPPKPPAGLTKPGAEPERAGEKRALKEQARFWKFFYVIGDETFRKLRPDAATLFKKLPDKAALPGEKVPAEVRLAKAHGLMYADLKIGAGDEAAAGDEVDVQYTGWLEKDGTKFDGSLDHGGKPFTFTIGEGGVIKGWDLGVPGMKTGGKRKLVIPANLGYGAQGSPPKIPAGASLVFDVELVAVRKKAPAPPPAEEKKLPEAEKPAAPEAKPADEEKTPEAKAPEGKTPEETTPEAKTEAKTPVETPAGPAKEEKQE
ncbi:MAG: FKBP-type peptidyl-prolyl cis-trans isomerase [Planctomycetota bacterium]|nr:FKBP-type peptidyl-prolyl cis-trans isomerase [Planctomycetota bacterium]